MLLEIGIGDAYGAGFEYATEMIATHNNLTHYIDHPRHNIKAGHYTDDTQMSIAIAEVIISGQPWTPEILSESFVKAFKRDPRQGYAGGFYSFLQSVKDGQEFLAKIGGDSDKSGAAMRACPIGIFPSVEEVLDKCTTQAKITHNSIDGIGAANAAALMAHYFLYKLGKKEDLPRFLDKHVPGYNWGQPWRGKVKSKGWMSVRAAITAILENNKMSDLLRNCINFTGDVDTVAAIALGAAAASSEITPDLPVHLIVGLEQGPYGRNYLAELDIKLLALLR